MGKKTRQTEEEVGRQHQGMDKPGVREVPEGRVEQRKMEKTGCEVICGAPTTPAVKRSVIVKCTHFSAWLKTGSTHSNLIQNNTGVSRLLEIILI